VVAVKKRFERGPIRSRVGAFPDVFSTANSKFKGMESTLHVNQGLLRFRLGAGGFGNNWCMFVR